MLAAQLNELGVRPPSGGQGGGRHQNGGSKPVTAVVTGILDSDSDDTEDDDDEGNTGGGRQGNDGTLLASDPPKPLPVDAGQAAIIHENKGPSSSGGGAPNRPLPPTPDEEENSDRTLVMRRNQHLTKNDVKRQSDIDEQLLLKDWDFARFFQGFNERLDRMKAESEAKHKEEGKLKENDCGKEKVMEKNHKRNGSDNARVFRRENSDFFVPSVRHSAVFLESKNVRQNPFNCSSRRGSDVAGLVGSYSNVKPSEPVLTDFNINGGEWQPVRPRRERTEGDIVLQKSRQELRDNLEARRLDVEMRFSREAEKMRKRNQRPVTETETVHASSSSSEERQNRDDRRNDFHRMDSSPGQLGTPGSRTSSVLPDLLTQASSSPGTPNQRHDKSTSEEKQKSFLTFGFGAGGGGSRRESHVNVNVTPTSHDIASDTPEIRKYKKRFSSEILCAALWGVNLLIGTETGLMLLDRSGQGKVYQLISRRRFQQMEVLEGQNILVTVSGKKNRVRVYYLSWLKSKILRTDGVSDQVERRNGWINVGDLQGAVHFRIVKYERIKFLVIALKDSIEIYAWAPKPYHKFMAFKSFGDLAHRPLLVDLTVEEGSRLKVIYGSADGFHAVDLDSGSVYDIYLPKHTQGPISPHCIVALPNSNGMQLLLCYDNEGVYVNTYGKLSKNIVLQWGEMPTSVAYIGTGQIMGWGNKAIEIRSVETGHLDGVFMHKKSQRLKFLCERNDKVFFSSAKGGSSCQIYFMTLNKPGMANW
uniref:non-specific serine/threonine protein kinase n=3 Tax=Clastoptera arizonana TaxID=38151 RepID=A0A1B6C8E6_9HEMI